MIILHEDVSRLEISMYDSVVVDVRVAIDDLIHECHGLILRDNSLIGDELGEISAITEFSDDIGVVLGIVDVVNFYDIFAIFQNLEHLYLRGEKILMHLSLDHLHIDDFNSHSLIYII